MKRFVLLALAILAAAPAFAQDLTADNPNVQWKWKPLIMRNTSASSVAQELNWAKGSPGSPPIGFVDSLVFRRSASATSRDTSAAYPVSLFRLPPHVGPNGGAVALSDTTLHSPWISIRVRQDTTSYSWGAVGTAMDSIYFAAQVSADNGLTWNSVNGTPTKAFEVTNGTADAQGVVPTLLGPFGEPVAGADYATAYLGCVPALAPINSSYNLNQTLCMCQGLIRFIFTFDGTGQFAPEVGHWEEH